jgi:hypothetical protein
MITKEQAELVLKKNIENIIKKAAEGNILTGADVEILESAVVEVPTVAKNWTELSKHLQISRKALWEHRKKKGCPLTLNVQEWQGYLTKRANVDNPHWQNEEFQDADIKGMRAKLLHAQTGMQEANLKLKEYELKRVEQELVPMSSAKDAIKKVLSPLRSLLDALPKSAAVQLNPTDPVHAEVGLRDALDKIYKMMEEAYKDASKPN